MNALTILGLASLVFVIVFTIHACRGDQAGSGQTRQQSIVEVWVGLCVGFLVNFVMNFLLLPMVGATFSAAENLSLGLVYTSVSILRGYTIRRWADRHIHKLSEFLSFGRGSKA